MTEAMLDHLWGRRFAVLYRARLSTLYHAKHDRFLSALAGIGAVLSPVFAAAATVQLANPSEWRVVVAAAGLAAVVVATVAACSLRQAQRRHANAAAAFAGLIAEAERAGEHWTEAQCNEFAGRLAGLEVNDPAPLCALVIACQNQLGLDAEAAPAPVVLTRTEQWFKHVWAFDPCRIAQRERGRI